MLTLKGHCDRTVIVLVEPATLPTRPSLAGFAKGMFERGDDSNDPLEAFAE